MSNKTLRRIGYSLLGIGVIAAIWGLSNQTILWASPEEEEQARRTAPFIKAGAILAVTGVTGLVLSLRTHPKIAPISISLTLAITAGTIVVTATNLYDRANPDRTLPKSIASLDIDESKYRAGPIQLKEPSYDSVTYSASRTYTTDQSRDAACDDFMRALGEIGDDSWLRDYDQSTLRNCHSDAPGSDVATSENYILPDDSMIRVAIVDRDAWSDFDLSQTFENAAGDKEFVVVVSAFS